MVNRGDTGGRQGGRRRPLADTRSKTQKTARRKKKARKWPKAPTRFWAGAAWQAQRSTLTTSGRSTVESRQLGAAQDPIHRAIQSIRRGPEEDGDTAKWGGWPGSDDEALQSVHRSCRWMAWRGGSYLSGPGKVFPGYSPESGHGGPDEALAAPPVVGPDDGP